MEKNVVNLGLIILGIMAVQQTSSNLLCNGDFQEYGITYVGYTVFSFVPSNYSCWYNSIGESIEVQQPGIQFLTAILDLSHNYQYILCQNVTLQPEHLYRLDFAVYNSLYILNSTVLVSINNATIFNHTTPTPSTISKASTSFTANSSQAKICFDSIYLVSPYSASKGPCLDNITLTQLINMTMIDKSVSQHYQLDQTTKLAFTVFISLPLKLILSLKCFYLLLDDIWLYNYAEHNYSGLIQVAFQTTTSIQLFKFEYLEKYIGWNHYKTQLRISGYENYTIPKFVELEGASSILLDSNFAFFVYSVPQKVIVCLSLYLIFCLLYNYRISKYIRKFYFFKTCLAITLLEENLAYFVFVCLLNMNHFFSFGFADKLSFAFTTLVLFCLVYFAVCFFPLMYKYLRNRASNFLDFTYRENASFWYKSVSLMRNLLRSVAFCFFHYQLRNQLLMLSVIEVLALSSLITIELSYRVFRSRSMFSCYLAYYFLFALLDLIFLAQDIYSQNQVLTLIKRIEEITLYNLIGIIVIMMTIDILSSCSEEKLRFKMPEKEFQGKQSNKVSKINKPSKQNSTTKKKIKQNRNLKNKSKQKEKMHVKKIYSERKKQNHVITIVRVVKSCQKKTNKLHRQKK